METLTDLLKVAVAHAKKLGAENGKAAASWVFNGNTSNDTYRAILAGIEDGDPAVLDSLPQPDEDNTADALDEALTNAGIPMDDVTDAMVSEVSWAYENLFTFTVQDEVSAAAARALAD